MSLFLNSRFWALFCVLSLTFWGGCRQPKQPVVNNIAPARPDFSIPRLTPKPVIWLEDWQGEPELSPARAKATELMRKGDALKSAGNYTEAEKIYLQAMDADPTFDYPPYQLACNYELSGNRANSRPMFEEAIKRGLDDFPTVLNDDELGSIRERSDFADVLKILRERYVASSATKVGQPIAVRPQGTKPAGGWPVMVLLHGYGDTNLSYLDHCELWAKSGFVTIAVPGSVPASSGRFMWDLQSAAPTQQDVQAIIQSPLLAAEINKDQVFLQGFSQGALHAMILTMEHPDQYAGVVSIAPGGSIADRIVDPQLTTAPRTIRCVFIHGDREAHAPIVEAWRAACAKANWKFTSSTHPGGHHFPKNWLAMQPDIAKFLLE